MLEMSKNVKSEKISPPWGLYWDKTISTNPQDIKDISIKIKTLNDNTGSLDHDSVSDIFYNENGNNLDYRLHREIDGEIWQQNYYSLNRITGSFQIRITGKIRDIKRCKKFIDCDKNGFATLAKKYYQCKKAKGLF